MCFGKEAEGSLWYECLIRSCSSSIEQTVSKTCRANSQPGGINFNPKISALSVIKTSGQERPILEQDTGTTLLVSLDSKCKGGASVVSLCWITVEKIIGNAETELGLERSTKALDECLDIGFRNCGLIEYTGGFDEIELWF